jgi:predicted PurR-regulated permease PerM
MFKFQKEPAITSNQSVAIKIPFSTVAIVLATLLFVKALGFLLPLIMPLLLGTILAISLAPVPKWLESKNIPRGLSVAFMSLLMMVGIVGSAILVLPRLAEQTTDFVNHLPELKQEILNFLPEGGTPKKIAEHYLSHQALSVSNIDTGSLLNAGHIALGGVGEFLLILIFAIYLVADGPRIFEWLSAFFEPETQKKLTATSEQVSSVVFAYVLGQVITSLLSFFYVLGLLTVLKVPAALLLAVLAGLFDVLPVLGFFLAVVPAMLFALKVSAPTALIVFAGYIAYHAIENYFIVPAVYGSRLRISTFVVLLSLLAAGLLAGIEGAIAALPIVASYPIIEKIWLRRYVGETTLKEHARIES